MANSKKIIISIDKAGYVKAEISGAKGAACKEYIALVEELVNGKAVDETLTAEYYQQETGQSNESPISNQQ
ncbi:DUF2997 domain-containing protein [Chitinophaga nivalis]|uniref:DUF2997 domain-containing protein n=1 Tax=Chitinophaga nivalis TaxID=2991709 RepID=A0ABT3IQP3_9BACT|nr:DUF2997 domain-containing protein [Chitinophaga nivalis]MCW3463998.1 DUF2997 domain-containing protein [Chitinophaga nivalis]MCW3486312.1 DUF2997 domain-containing protein [Chitinophaga nivalis]